MINMFKIQRGVFWEIDESKIEETIQTNPDFSIPRIFERGTIEEIFDMIDFYGEEKVKKTLCAQLKRNINYIRLAKVMFDLKEKDFACYTNKQFLPIY